MASAKAPFVRRRAAVFDGDLVKRFLRNFHVRLLADTGVSTWLVWRAACAFSLPRRVPCRCCREVFFVV